MELIGSTREEWSQMKGGGICCLRTVEVEGEVDPHI